MALTVATVETAIEAILTNGQSVSLDGVSYSGANLDTLYKMRDQLKKETNRATRPTIRAINFGGMGY